MIFVCGLSGYNISLFHLMNHAFFKALLFLSAGTLIHSLNNEQDLRKMGSLAFLIPISYNMILLGTLSLTGFPFLSGFYSKDVCGIYQIKFSATIIMQTFSFVKYSPLLNSYDLFTLFYHLILLIFFIIFIFNLKNSYIKM
jgi:NADH-ubiquinone oxidoreductase chain 5